MGSVALNPCRRWSIHFFYLKSGVRAHRDVHVCCRRHGYIKLIFAACPDSQTLVNARLPPHASCALVLACVYDYVSLSSCLMTCFVFSPHACFTMLAFLCNTIDPNVKYGNAVYKFLWLSLSSINYTFQFDSFLFNFLYWIFNVLHVISHNQKWLGQRNPQRFEDHFTCQSLCTVNSFSVFKEQCCTLLKTKDNYRKNVCQHFFYIFCPCQWLYHWQHNISWHTQTFLDVAFTPGVCVSHCLQVSCYMSLIADTNDNENGAGHSSWHLVGGHHCHSPLGSLL